MIESKRGPSAGEDEASWLGRISEIDAKQERLLDLRPDGNITPEQFRAKSARLGEAHAAAEAQLQAASSRLSHLMVMCLCFRARCSSFCPCSFSEPPGKNRGGTWHSNSRIQSKGKTSCNAL